MEKSDIREQVLNYLKENFDSNFKETDTLRSHGFGSLDCIETETGLEKVFGVIVPFEGKFYPELTVNDIVDLIEKLKK